MNIFDYLYESNGIHYFKEPTTLTIADIDKDQIYRGQAQKNFDKGKSYNPLPVLIFPDANSLILHLIYGMLQSLSIKANRYRKTLIDSEKT